VPTYASVAPARLKYSCQYDLTAAGCQNAVSVQHSGDEHHSEQG
jgi:hypothetical protein